MQPLVTVGIPTYNRPEGLRKTLQCITQQSYKNLQIIVADNCSENENVKIVAQEFVKKDPRVLYYKHEENKGVNFNFKFVLNKAEGLYFMWAADDDDWSLEFIKELVSIIGDRSAAFSNYSVRYVKTGRADHIKIIASATGNSKYEQARNYLQERIPSLFYGIYKTNDIKWFVEKDKLFDWFDCYFVFKTILIFNGYAFSDKELYSAGVHGNSYEYKPMTPNNKRIFTYSPYFVHSSKLIFQSDINFQQKLKLLLYLIEVNFRAFLVTEKIRKNYRLYSLVYRVYNRLRPPLFFYEH